MSTLGNMCSGSQDCEHDCTKEPEFVALAARVDLLERAVRKALPYLAGKAEQFPGGEGEVLLKCFRATLEDK